jgi:23S rRNA pseudouridine2605 synthase
MTDNLPSPSEATRLQRLQRVMAAAGIGSRRECELIIQEGRVEVDGQVVATLGAKVDPEHQKIFVDGQRIVPQRLEYYMLNKPPGVVSTSYDPSGRARVIDLIDTHQRVYNVGRLDQSSEGLILVTNDGELANKLTHPKYGIYKTYQVKVDGVPTPQQLRSLEEGIFIAEGKAQAKSARLLRKSETHGWLEIVLAEGKNREIRRILAKLGHKVRVLKRVAIGPLKLAELPVGAHRRLTAPELKELKRAAEGLSPGWAEKKTSRTSRKFKTQKPRPGKTQHGQPQTGKFQRGGFQPGKSHPGKPRPGKPRPGKPRPGKPRPGKPRPGKSSGAMTTGKSFLPSTESGAVDRKSKPSRLKPPRPGTGLQKRAVSTAGEAERSKRSKRRSGPKQISQLTKFNALGTRDSAFSSQREKKSRPGIKKKRR